VRRPGNVTMRGCAVALGVLAGAGAAACLRSAPTRTATSAPGAARGHADAGALDLAARQADAGEDGGAISGREGDAGAPPEVVPPRHYQRVLHVGDSTVGGYGGLAKALKTRFAAENTRYVSDTIVSLAIRTLAHGKTLKADIARNDPDLVLLTVGTNDVFLPSPEQMAGDVRAIVAAVGSRDCYWIGPPTWKQDTGIVAVIRANAGHCRFFDSSLLPLARARDGVHPTDRGGEDWAARFWSDFRAQPLR
jgi:hypothetical protein